MSQAHFAMLKCLLINGKGCVRIDHDKEKPRLTISVNRQRIISDGKPALEDMLLRLHMYRVTADVDVCRPYYENLSTVEDEHLEWRRTLRAQKTPRLHYVHANTFLEGDNVRLTEYEASHAGLIQSWFERAV
jgi:dipeptidyl-peptidase III